MRTRGYSMQAIDADGENATAIISDTQLAAAWLYADVVHADAQGPKAEALAFPISDRYAAAVALFSHLALLTLETMKLIKWLQDNGLVSIEKSAWKEAVTIRPEDFTREIIPYYAQSGTDAPDLRASTKLSDEWTQVTPMEILRQNPRNRVSVELYDGQGALLAAHDAVTTCFEAKEEDGTTTWKVLAAHGVTFTFATKGCSGSPSRQTALTYQFESDLTNKFKFEAMCFFIQFCEAKEVVFEVGDRVIVSCASPALSYEMLVDLKIKAQALEDIVALEDLTGQTFEALDLCRLKLNDYIGLRRVRLISEGHVIRAMSGGDDITTPSGNPPGIIEMASGKISIGNIEVPYPKTCFSHPKVVVTESKVGLCSVEKGKLYKVEAPSGERLLAWSPEKREIADLASLAPTASLDLICIDEDEILF